MEKWHKKTKYYFKHDGFYYVNAVPSQGNGLFMKITDLDNDYSIDQAIERFGIDEDVEEFEDSQAFTARQPSYSN